MAESIVESSKAVLDVAKTKRIRVLHVEDDLTFLSIAKQCLELQGPFHVDTAGSVEEALSKMKEKEYDAVVSDYQMPGRDGLEFLKQLRKKGNNIPFIILTGKGREEVAIKALNLGADRYLNKTVSPETFYYELAHAISQAVDRRSTQIELLKREAKLEAILESSPEAITITDLNGNVIECNQVAVDMHGGQSKEDLVGKNALGLIAEKDREKAVQNLNKTLKQGSVKTVEYTFLAEDGREFPAELSASVVRDDSGEPELLVAITRDITERKAAERAIQDSHQYAENIVATMCEPLVILDQDLKLVSANRSFYESFKATPKETVGRHIYEIGNGQWDIPELRQLLEDILPKHAVFNDFKVEHDFSKIGFRTLLLNARRLRNETNEAQMILLTIEDVTEKTLLQQKLSTSDKLAAIGQLASSVGHEIRNPLGVIKNSAYFLNMILKDVANERVVKHLKILEKEVNSANLIISDLLDFARKKTITLDLADLNEIVKNALSYITVPVNVKVEIKLGEIPKMQLDEERVRRVCQNLILNAVQAMPEGGKLTIRTTKKDDSAKLVVRDTGVGISKETMSRLFTPLFSTKAKGIGLGLVICKQIVEDHNGSITVESRVGEGSTFTVKLPIRTEKKINEPSAFTMPMPIEGRIKIEK